MSTYNKQSVREESERIEHEFEKLSNDGNMNNECKTLFKGMLLINKLLISIFLEKKTKKTSDNSSIPPSQTEKDETSPSNTGTNGKGKNESNDVASNTRTIVNTSVVEVNKCDVCGHDLTDTPCEHHDRRTKIDIVFEKVVEHIDAEVKTCANCDSTVKGKFPDDMPGPLQYGTGLKAFIINLLVAQMVSLNRAQKMIKSLVGQVISESTLLKFIWRLHEALAVWEYSAKQSLLQSATINVDETSLRVDKKKHWIHVYSAGDVTLKLLHRKRGTEAINKINIIPRYGGIIIHDCWSSYLAYNNCGHGLCGSHLTRELTYIIETNDYRWAANMKNLLLETSKIVSKRKRKKLNKKEYANLQKRYRNILTRGEKELPAIPLKPKGKRGKIAKSDAHNLWERLKKHESSVLLFSKDTDVSFTNNRAEQDLRMSKVKQKVSGCFRAERYAKAYCRISSYLQTMASKGHNPLIAIEIAFNGEFTK
tara:strand:- start:36 stop:1475 length:1440 start_codon:yes stop_codon:yes gene_type:complete